jgi:glycosyltransferase involved in cell wall biosynthesis
MAADGEDRDAARRRAVPAGVTYLAPELQRDDAGRLRAHVRIAWLGHKSQTMGDGLRTYSREVTRGLAGRGAEIVFVHHEAGLADGASSYSLDGRTAFQRRFTIAGARDRRRLEDLLREHAVDVVHVSAPFSTLDFSLPEICHGLGVPLVVTYHVPFARELSRWSALAAFANRVYARALAASDRVIVSGQAQRQLVMNLGVSDQLIKVMPNGIDTDKYSPGPSAALETFNADRIFSFIGRIDPEKEVELLVRAFLDASPPPSLRLVVAGDGFDLARLRRRYRDQRILFLGMVLDEAQRIDILRASDAFFLPSRVEALSLALLEAMSCGIATAATAVGNHREFLEDVGVVLRPSRLLDDLRTAIADFIETPARCSSLGERARARALELFSLDAHLDGLITLYRELVRRPVPVQSERIAEGAAS